MIWAHVEPSMVIWQPKSGSLRELWVCLYSNAPQRLMVGFLNSAYAVSARRHIKPYEPHSPPWLMEFPISRLENVSQLGVSV